MLQLNFIYFLSFLIVQVLPIFNAKSAHLSGKNIRDGKTILYVGSYTNKPIGSESWLVGNASNQSIRTFQLNIDGSLTLLREYGADYVGMNSIYMTTTKNFDYLYSVNSDENDGRQSNITAFRIDKTNNGELKKMNSYIGTGGENAVHISLDENENFIFVAHYSGNGTLSVFRRNRDGSIGARVCLEKYQYLNNSEPHPHSAWSYKNKFIYVPDLGRNLVLNYEIDPISGTCIPNPNQPNGIHPTNGPRHMAFHPNGYYAYIVNELSSEMDIVFIDPSTGKLEIIRDKISTLPSGVSPIGQAAGAIRISPEVFIVDNQKFIFVSNRGITNSISVFKILMNGNSLSYVGTYDTLGLVPRDFYVLKDTLVVVNQNSASIVTFKIGSDGSLTRAFGPMNIGLPLAVISIQI